MKKMSVCLAVVCCVVFLGGIAVAQQKGPVEKVLEGCSTEFETYCKNVTPGEGRLLPVSMPTATRFQPGVSMRSMMQPSSSAGVKHTVLSGERVQG